MTYPLLDHCNRRNAAELARGDLDARPLMSEGWAAPTGEVVRGWHLERYPRPFPDGTMLAGGRRLGRGDRIHCGEQILQDEVAATIARGDREALRGFYRYCNVCRPFDEKWDEPRVPLFDRHPLGEKRTRDDFPYATKFKAENSKPERQTPPNHGHGAACGCVTVAKLYELQDIVFPSGAPGSLTGKTTAIFRGKRVAILNPQIKKTPATIECVPFDCPHCSGTGRLICDDERAGRVSPSHAAGGYAEWQRRQLRITAVDWDAGIARFGPYVESK